MSEERLIKGCEIGIPQKKESLFELEDGEHFHLKCKKCGSELAEIWVTSPSVDIKLPVKATCCFCPGESVVVSPKGLYRIGHVEDGKCVVTNIETKDEHVVLTTTPLGD